MYLLRNNDVQIRYWNDIIAANSGASRLCRAVCVVSVTKRACFGFSATKIAVRLLRFSPLLPVSPQRLKINKMWSKLFRFVDVLRKSQSNQFPIETTRENDKKQTRRDAPKSLYTCLYDNLPIQYIWLNDWSNMSSSISLICSLRISHQILCTTFRKYPMNLISKLSLFGSRLVELYLEVSKK